MFVRVLLSDGCIGDGRLWSDIGSGAGARSAAWAVGSSEPTPPFVVHTVRNSDCWTALRNDQQLCESPRWAGSYPLSHHKRRYWRARADRAEPGKLHFWVMVCWYRARCAVRRSTACAQSRSCNIGASVERCRSGTTAASRRNLLLAAVTAREDEQQGRCTCEVDWKVFQFVKVAKGGGDNETKGDGAVEIVFDERPGRGARIVLLRVPLRCRATILDA